MREGGGGGGGEKCVYFINVLANEPRIFSTYLPELNGKCKEKKTLIS